MTHDAGRVWLSMGSVEVGVAVLESINLQFSQHSANFWRPRRLLCGQARQEALLVPRDAEQSKLIGRSASQNSHIALHVKETAHRFLDDVLVSQLSTILGFAIDNQQPQTWPPDLTAKRTKFLGDVCLPFFLLICSFSWLLEIVVISSGARKILFPWPPLLTSYSIRVCPSVSWPLY